MVEQSFVTSLIKSDGSIFPFFSRPVAAVLAAMTMAALFWSVGAVAGAREGEIAPERRVAVLPQLFGFALSGKNLCLNFASGKI